MRRKAERREQMNSHFGSTGSQQCCHQLAERCEHGVSKQSRAKGCCKVSEQEAGVSGPELMKATAGGAANLK